jgi:hypothetical protein
MKFLWITCLAMRRMAITDLPIQMTFSLSKFDLNCYVLRPDLSIYTREIPELNRETLKLVFPLYIFRSSIRKPSRSQLIRKNRLLIRFCFFSWNFKTRKQINSSTGKSYPLQEDLWTQVSIWNMKHPYVFIRDTHSHTITRTRSHGSFIMGTHAGILCPT